MKIALFIWRVRTSAIPFAILRMALDRFALRKVQGLTFVKLLGTGKGETFTPRDADLWQWALLVVGTEAAISEVKKSPLVKRWNRRVSESANFDLAPISSHGRWAKQTPFTNETSEIQAPKNHTGQVAAITRARIKWSKNLTFWRAVPPVITELNRAPGLIAAIGIGEAPLGLQGTFSLWESASALRTFAYKGEAHQRAIADTERIGWYSEELFSRFEVLEMSGSLKNSPIN